MARSICLYSSGGARMRQLVFNRDGKVISIEATGVAHRAGTSVRGADSFELVTHSARAMSVRYRPPRSRQAGFERSCMQ